MSDATQTPPGWYPDANAPGGQRWWDGTQWTEHVAGAPQAYATPAAAPKAADGTKTGTVWIWLIVLLPLLSMISLLFVDWKAYIDTSIGASGGSYSSTNPALAIYADPGYLISTLLGWVLYGLTVVFAALDVRALKARGVPSPFHWAFAFLTATVYVIGRSVVVKRRTGGGLAPLWAYIGVIVLSIIASIVLVVLIFQYVFSVVPIS